MKGKALFAVALIIIILGAGIKSSKKCGEATYVNTYLIFSVADWTIPGFDLCD